MAYEKIRRRCRDERRIMTLTRVCYDALEVGDLVRVKVYWLESVLHKHASYLDSPTTLGRVVDILRQFSAARLVMLNNGEEHYFTAAEMFEASALDRLAAVAE